MRRIVAGGLLLLAVAVPSAAHATRLAGLKLVPAGGPPGTEVRVTGTWFATAEDGFAARLPVRMRWGGTSGPVLAEVQPDDGGTFITHITVPAGATPGQHLLVATQTVVDRTGQRRPAPGTPARAAVTVERPGARAESADVRTAPAPPPARNAGAPAATAAAALVAAAGMLLFAGAGWRVVRELRHPRGTSGAGRRRRPRATVPDQQTRKGG